MVLMLMVVLCYTICSLSDKYAVAKIKFNGNELTFLMAAATALFMTFALPFVDTRVEGNVIISDLRGVDPIYSGNRFMIYSMYPEQNISCWIVNGKGGKGCSAAVGYSILNKTSDVNVGSLMLKYGGGGHKAVGTCQFSDENMDTELPKMLDELIAMSNK